MLGLSHRYVATSARTKTTCGVAEAGDSELVVGFSNSTALIVRNTALGVHGNQQYPFGR